MASRPMLLLGNIVAIVVTIVAFLQAISWPVAGALILVSLVIPLLANISPPRGTLTSHSSSKIPATSHHSQTETKGPQHPPTEKHPLPSHQTPGLKTSSKVTAATINVPQTGLPKVAPVKLGPNFNPTIAKGDYAEYDVELDAGKDFSGDVTATGLVNVYLLDEDNLDNLDQGEEFWSETGEEGVESAKLEFTAPSKGKWFFVVENADDRAVSATVKLQKGSPAPTAST